MMITELQMKKPNFREIKWLTQGHAISKKWSKLAKIYSIPLLKVFTIDCKFIHLEKIQKILWETADVCPDSLLPAQAMFFAHTPPPWLTLT